MKHVFLFLVCFVFTGAYAQVGIGTTSPDASAALDVTSTTQGLLLPRMTGAQRNAIVNPAVGLMIFCTDCRSSGEPQYFNGAWYNLSSILADVFCNSGATTVVEVTNPSTGRVWMDRNLGATQAAASSTDAASYGDLYQWGRRSDGHQCRNSTTITSLSNTDQPLNTNFISAPNAPWNWRSPQNVNLWQGASGVNNPCPTGFRIPTETELDEERLSWESNNAAGAFASPLKLPLAGNRFFSGGSLSSNGTVGHYWSSTVNSSFSRRLIFSSIVGFNTENRANGYSVRCIKN